MHWSYPRLLALGALLISSGFGALALCSGFWSVAATVVVFTFGEMLMLPAAAAYLTDLAPPGRSGEYVGMQSALISMSMLLAPAIGTFVLQRHGGVAVWTLMALLGSVSVISLMTLPTLARR
jgi:MFS family permease